MGFIQPISRSPCARKKQSMFRSRQVANKYLDFLTVGMPGYTARVPTWWLLSPLDGACILLATVPIYPYVYLPLSVSCYLSSQLPCYFAESSIKKQQHPSSKNGKRKDQESGMFQERQAGIFLCRNKGFSYVFNRQGFLRPGQHEALTWPLGFLLACEYATPESTVLATPWHQVSPCCNPLRCSWPGGWLNFINFSSSLFSFFPKDLLSHQTFKPVTLTPLHTNIIVFTGTFSLSNLPWNNWVIALEVFTATGDLKANRDM